MKTPFAWLVVGCGLWASTSAPPTEPRDSWGPFRNRRVASASGRHYAVLRRGQPPGSGRFELVERRLAAGPIRSLLAPPARDGGDAAIARDRADRLLCEGALPHLPMDAAVLGGPPGILLFDTYARVGRARVLTLLDSEGRVAWSHDLDDLFGEVPEGTVHTTSSSWWSAGWGVDEARGVAWVLTLGDEFRMVRLRGGAISEPGAEELPGLLAGADAEGRVALLDAFQRRDDLDRQILHPLVHDLALDEGAPIEVRMRAAVLCRELGDRLDLRDPFVAATRHESMSVALYAAANLPRFFDSEDPAGPDPVAPLLEVLGRLPQPLEARADLWALLESAKLTRSALDALRPLGAQGIELLRAALERDDLESVVQVSLAVLWWSLGQTSVPDPVRAAIVEGPEQRAGDLLRALLGTEPDGSRRLLLELLREGTAADRTLADHFALSPDPAAAEPLERALARAARLEGDAGEGLRSRVARALDACRQK